MSVPTPDQWPRRAAIEQRHAENNPVTAGQPLSTNRTTDEVAVENFDGRTVLRRAANRLERIAQSLHWLGIARAGDDIRLIAVELERMARDCGRPPRDASSKDLPETDVEL